MISQSRPKGQSIISYLQKKGFPEVGLHFLKGEKTRLALALESGAIETALEAAEAIGDNDAFHRLASAALKQGKLEVFELCSQRTKDMDRLALLYVLTSKFEKLAKVRKIADAGGHLVACFQICMYLGDVEGRISVLRDCGQIAMAIRTSKSHGMAEELEELGGWDDSEVTVDPSWDPGAEGDFEEPTGDYYEDAAAFEASERDAVFYQEEEAVNAAVDPFAVGLATENTAANGDVA
ncbi:Coatomer subunit alpha WD40 repeat containing protein [Gracilaria domingensis]|nr:Coatomer subunit alpha WD40 repeat containing protein [Gracilaria domingensis]